MKCNQSDCTADATHRYTWPGRNEAGICDVHVIAALRIAEAMGMHLEFIPLDDDEGPRRGLP